MAKKKNQTIKCDVESCKHCDCDHLECTLNEIKVANQKKEASCEEDTICSSFDCRKE